MEGRPGGRCEGVWRIPTQPPVRLRRGAQPEAPAGPVEQARVLAAEVVEASCQVWVPILQSRAAATTAWGCGGHSAGCGVAEAEGEARMLAQRRERGPLGSVVLFVEFCVPVKMTKVRCLTAPVYLENEGQMGKVDELFGQLREVFIFQLNCQEI